MNCIFYGTLRDEDIQRKVLGQTMDRSRSQLIELQDKQLYYVEGALYPAIVAAHGHRCQAEVYFDLTRSQIQQLCDYEEDEYTLEKWEIDAYCAYIFVPASDTRIGGKIWTLSYFQKYLKRDYLQTL